MRRCGWEEHSSDEIAPPHVAPIARLGLDSDPCPNSAYSIRLRKEPSAKRHNYSSFQLPVLAPTAANCDV